MNNYILDYEQARGKLRAIAKRNVIKKEENLAVTEYGLPIEHYTVGEGNLDIVISGAIHGSEIISTDFVIRLMAEITREPKAWESILKQFKIHFIPMVNPEGYLISRPHRRRTPAAWSGRSRCPRPAAAARTAGR